MTFQIHPVVDQKKENHRSETATPVPRLLTKGPVTVQGSKTVTDKGSKTVGGTVEAGKKRKGKPSSVWHKKPKKTSSKQKKREIAKEEEEKQIRDDDERREEDERDSIQQSEP